MNKMNIRDYHHIYMIGIGGISMSGLAEILRVWHYEVSGSDRVSSLQTEDLKQHGIQVFIPQQKENITDDIDLVVYTAAIPQDNPELVAAREKNIPTMERGAFLGELTKLFSKTIGIAGTHGKTTTTSMVANCFLEEGLDPTVQVGAYLKNLDGNYRVGKSDYFIIEACEYNDSFLNFCEESAIVLNIDDDHMEYFKTMENMCHSYEEYVSKLSEQGVLVLNHEDERCLKLKDYTKAQVVTIGKSDADYTYQNVLYDEEGFPSFDVYKKGEFQAKVTLSVAGEHNIFNSLSCIALCRFYQISWNSIQEGLKKFTGAARRMEYKGVFCGAKVFDDYAHHPTEVLATAKSIGKKTFHESWVVFECHSYSRLFMHMDEFSHALELFDHVIVTDIYAARETNTYQVHESDLVSKINEKDEKAIFISGYDAILVYLKSHVQKDDIVLTMGAGTITKLADKMMNEA